MTLPQSSLLSMHRANALKCRHGISLSYDCSECRRKGSHGAPIAAPTTSTRKESELCPNFATTECVKKTVTSPDALMQSRSSSERRGVVPSDTAPNYQTWHFVIPGAPVGKPRQTQSDKWKQRPCVMRYRAWADKARAAAPSDLTSQPLSVKAAFWLPMPKSWRKPYRDALRGNSHRHKPDIDNLVKSALDALFKRDECAAILFAEKRWDDGHGPRIELTITAP